MKEFKLFIAGDFCSKPTTTYITVSEELKNLIQSSELKVVNFEVPLKPDVELPPQQYERFWQHDDAPEFLRGLGFNLFSIANNHAFDWGNDGFKKTKSALAEQAFGAGTYDEAYKVKVCEVNGVKVGFMALAYAAYTGVFDDVLNHEGLGCAYINDLRVNHDIVQAKKQVDYLFILPHDGIEYIDVPLPETIARYRDFIDWGADGVIGSHPHCPQGWEEYKGKPIFYSLGNFFFNSKEDTLYRAWNRPHWYEGMCVEMTLGDGDMHYRIINTHNIDNVSLVVDHDASRDEHNEKLASYLKDDKAYRDYLQAQCRRLAEGQEMPIIDGSFHKYSLKSSLKRLLKSWLQVIQKKEVSNDFALRTLLRNNTRSNVLLRYLRRNY
ncbi:MAG: CapA family protein [bacterium]|nr:CapA family protein [bacterium]